MGKTYLKQEIKTVINQALHSSFPATSEAEVERYTYATKLGNLPEIDYAIPLFSHAREAQKPPQTIYEQLTKALHAQLQCQTEFVNGYMNIMLDNEVLKHTLQEHLATAKPTLPPTTQKIVLLVHTSDDTLATTATNLIEECLKHVGIMSEALYPFPEGKPKCARYALDAPKAQEMRSSLKKLSGFELETDSPAAYLVLGDESFALCSVKGNWYLLAFVLVTILKRTAKGQRIFAIGLSEVNHIVRTLFPEVSALDVDVHARYLNTTLQHSLRKLVTNYKHEFQERDFKRLDSKQRRELIYALDFDYEVNEAVKSGNLKRLLGEIATLLRQQPFPYVTRD